MSGSPGTKLLITMIILLVAGLAAWGVFALVTSRFGYAEAVKRFEAAEVQFGSEEVRLTASDETYHRKYHRPDEGRLGTLSQAGRLGYKPCWICSPRAIGPLPHRPVLAWAGGGAVFVLVGGVLGGLNARRLGLQSFVPSVAWQDSSLAVGARPPSHFRELAGQFDVLRLQSEELLHRLAGPNLPVVRVLQAEALSIAVLRWAARWTHREIATSADVEQLEDEVAPQEAPPDAVVVDGRSDAARWYELEFEYRQLLWKAVAPSTGQVLLESGTRLLDRLIRDARPADLAPRLHDAPDALNDLSDILAVTVEFFRRQYASDARFHRTSRPSHP